MIARATLLSTLALLLATTGCASDSRVELAGLELPGLEEAPNFELEDAGGTRVRLSDQRGKVVFVTFLYTRCPDVCPFIDDSLNRALQELGADRKSVRVLAISVDPAGDTAARVKKYSARHHLRPEFHYLIGSAQELEAVWRAYDVVAFAADPETELVDHTAQTLLVDREGRLRASYAAGTSSGDYVHDIRELLDR